jgi:NAD(P)H-nitrite reductase large subunit
MDLQRQDNSQNSGISFDGDNNEVVSDTILDPMRDFNFSDDISTSRIKICGGTVFCPEGKQDSLDLGLKLEERLHNIYLPSKISFGVSGCGNRCAESCDKDIGIVGMEDGWDIFVGGNTRRDTKHPWPLARGLSTRRVLEVVDKIVAIFRTGYKDKKQLTALIESIGFENFKAKVLSQNKTPNK